MARTDRDWDALGRHIQDIVDQAVNSRDYQQLNQTIRNVVEQAVDLGGEALKKAASNSASSRTVRQPRTVYPPQATPAQEAPRPLPVLYSSTGNQTALGLAKAVGGGMLSVGGFLGFVSSALVRLLITGTGILSFSTGVLAAAFAAGVCLTVSGAKTLGRISRFKAYRNALGQKTHIGLNQLSRAVGRNVRFVRKELYGMIDDGLFLEGHLDNEEQNLIVSDETYRHYEQSRLALEERKMMEQAEKEKEAAMAKIRGQEQAAPTPAVKSVLDRGNAFLEEIRRCNDAIPGEEISAKISRIESIVGQIFRRAQAHPEIVPDLQKLMDYYLPMTVKLLRAYADMDAQAVQGETIQSSKREIEDTVDTLNLAFERLLDSIYKDTALDVSSDISVLNTLLAQEGLTDDGLAEMRKNHPNSNR